MQPAALPAPPDTGTGTDLNNQIPDEPPAPVSRRLIIGLPAGRLKDASGAAHAARPPPRSLTPPAARHGHGSLRATSAAPYPPAAPAQKPPKSPLDTAPLLHGRTVRPKPH